MEPNENGRLFTVSIEDKIDALVDIVCDVDKRVDPDTLRRTVRQAVADVVL